MTSSHTTRWLALLVLLCLPRVWGLAPEAIQGETLGEMIETLQSRHYEGKIYDDALSGAHLDAYIDALDPQKMFFTREDIEGFQTWRTRLDDLGRAGDRAGVQYLRSLPGQPKEPSGAGCGGSARYGDCL